jgi:hypothetical protein
MQGMDKKRGTPSTFLTLFREISMEVLIQNDVHATSSGLTAGIRSYIYGYANITRSEIHNTTIQYILNEAIDRVSREGESHECSREDITEGREAERERGRASRVY